MAVYEVENNHFTQIAYEQEFLQLNRYVKDDILIQEGIDATISFLKRMNEKATYYKTDKLYCFGTATLRNVNNSKVAVKTIENAINISIDIIDGEIEALYSSNATIQRYSINSGVVIDMGGGSTEIVLVEDGVAKQFYSMKFGVLSLTRMFTTFEKSSLFTQKNLGTVPFLSSCKAKDIYIVGGTFQSICKVLQSNNIIDNIKLSDLETIRDKYLSENLQIELLSFIGKRAETFICGLCAIIEIIKIIDAANIIACNTSVRDGYLMSKIR